MSVTDKTQVEFSQATATGEEPGTAEPPAVPPGLRRYRMSS
jgi:hypothetical protein